MRDPRTSLTSGLAGRLALWASLPLLTGCVGFIPVPSGKDNPPGTELTRRQTAFIQPGKTMRSEVIARLGTNYVWAPRQTAIAYAWDGCGVMLVGWYALCGPDAAVAGGGETEWAAWHGFFVASDEDNVVRAAAFKRLSTRRSLHENLGRWVARLPQPSARSP